MQPEKNIDKEWDCNDLYERLAKNEPLFLLDIRNKEAHSKWKITGQSKLETVNLPYFDLLELTGKDDLVEAAAALPQKDFPLPKDRTVVVICNRGNSSALTSRGLQRAGLKSVTLNGGMEAWSELYHFAELKISSALSIFQVSRPAKGCLSYMIVGSKSAFVIDPLRQFQNYSHFATERKLEIKAVLETHSHADHVSGGVKLSQELSIPYHLHPYDMIHPIDLLPGSVKFEPLQAGMQFDLEGHSIRTIHTPGHTLGHCAFVLNEKFLFSGDTLFLNSFSRPDLGGKASSWAPMHQKSLCELLKLPDPTLVLPGHFQGMSEMNSAGLYAATLAELRKINPSLKQLELSTSKFVEYINSTLPTFPNEYIEIKRVNIGLSTPSEEEQTELEVGQNLCALASKP